MKLLNCLDGKMEGLDIAAYFGYIFFIKKMTLENRRTLTDLLNLILIIEGGRFSVG